MPSKSKAQNRFVQAMASQGKPWAKEWKKEQHGHKVPDIEHVRKMLKHHKKKHKDKKEHG